MRATRWIVPFLSGLFVTSCPRSFDGKVYQGNGFSYRVAPPPADWQPLDVSDAALAFRAARSGGTIMVHGRCDRDGEDVPLSSLTQHLFLHFTERDIEREVREPFDGREVLKTTMRAKLDGVEHRYLVWVMKKDKCVYDLMFFSAPSGFESGGARFSEWAAGFSALPREGAP